MFIVDVILRVYRYAGDLARELLVRTELPEPPSQTEVDKAVESFVQNMLAGPDYPRLQKWLAKNQPIIEPETIGVFRVQ